MKEKLELTEMPVIDCVTAIIGDANVESLSEIIDLHGEMKQMIAHYNVLISQRKMFLDTAGTYLENNTLGLNADDHRKYLIKGIEYEMFEILRRRDRIKSIFDSVFNI